MAIARWQKVLFVVMFVVSIAGGFFAAKAKVTLHKTIGEHVTHDSEALSKVNLDNIKTESDDDIVNILLIGDDFRTYDGSASPGLYDVIMIGTLDKKHGTLKLTSIMRDTLVDVYGQGKKMKINASGRKDFGGIKNLYKTIAQNFNVKVDGYAKVGFEGFKAAVNSVGGITVDLSETEVKYLNKTNYVRGKKNRHLKVGRNTLNGAQALGYVRIRKGMDKIGEPVKTVTGLSDDYGRTWRQRTVLTAIFDKMKTKSYSKWLEVAEKVLDNVTTDLDNDQILGYMQDVIGLGTMDIYQLQIPIAGYYRDDKGTDFPSAQGWSLVPTNGQSRNFNPSCNSEALRKFIFKYDGKGKFKYKASTDAVSQAYKSGDKKIDGEGKEVTAGPETERTKKPVVMKTEKPKKTKNPNATEKPVRTKKPKITEKPTDKPVEKPTDKPTAKPTAKPKPTEKPVVKPTDPPQDDPGDEGSE